MTNKQRAKIYRKAAEELFINPQNKLACCDILSHLLYGLYGKPFCEQLPEFALFKPDNAGFFWWDHPNGTKAEEPRILALLLSAEIALNP